MQRRKKNKNTNESDGENFASVILNSESHAKRAMVNKFRSQATR
jgi:hypothetical protein